MTGVQAVVWFRGKRHNRVRLIKPDNLEEQREAETANRESAARFDEATQQRGAVTSVVSSLAEIRRRNHFADGIRAAMGGSPDEQT